MSNHFPQVFFSDCSNVPNPMQIFIVVNLDLLTDSKVLDPSRMQSPRPLTICLLAVGGNRSARRKPTLKSRSVTVFSPWQALGVSVLPKDRTWQ